jgi:glycosyltransferase involved in cell wall biosynthesis
MYLQKLARAEDILYVSTTSTLIPAFFGARIPCVQIVHDLIAFHNEPHDRKARLIERNTLGRALRHARAICTVSDATTRELLSRFPAVSAKKVATVYAGPKNTDTAMNVSDGKTIFCVGTLCPRKNQHRLIEAFSLLAPELRARVKLVLMGGRGWHDEGIIAAARSTPGVEWIGYGSEEGREELLQRCAVFAVPSLYEGFGLSMLDALQRGAIVITSRNGSLPEVAGDAAVYVDPLSPASIAEGISRCLSDQALQSRLRVAGPNQAKLFSWQKTVDRFLAHIAACG